MLTWRYTTADGRLVLDDAPGAPVARNAHALGGRWMVSDLTTARGVVCDVASKALHALADAQVGKDDFGYMWHPYQAQPASEGCLVAGAQRTSGADRQPVGPTAFVLYHFGLLLAANALAHRRFSALPQATADERALARSLALPQAQG